MNFPEEQHRIDVTTQEKEYKNQPAAKPRRTPRPPRRPLRLPALPTWDGPARAAARAQALLQALLCRPAVRLLLLLLVVGGAGAWAYARSRPPTIDGPALPTTGWRERSSPGMDIEAVLDPHATSGWTADGGGQGLWFEADMRKPQTFHQVVLDCREEPNDYPRDYAVYVSGDGRQWGEAVASGQGTGPVTIIDFPKTSARYIKVVDIQQDMDSGTEWSIDRFTVH